MGRKPNQLIAEFFERGAKLQDSSNRYQHTCKSCGEQFPKGRIDNLTAHLLKKCPAISAQDRQRAVQQLSETPNQHGSVNQLALSIRQEQVNSGDASYMSALDTLAEVSQHMNTNGQYLPGAQSQKKRKRSLGQSGEHRQTHQMQQQEMPVANLAQSLQAQQQAQQQMTDSQRADQDLIDANAQFLRELEQYTNAQNAAGAQQIPVSAPSAPTARMVSDQLAMTASAANDMIPPGGNLANIHTGEGAHFSMDGNGIESQAIDPQLQDSNIQVQFNIQSHPQPQAQIQMQHQQQHQQQTQQPHSMPLQLRPIAINPNVPHAPYLNDFTLSGDAPRHKVRGRFSATRRKEVQEVRKQGACIRCRMLKKPCSGGTPCNTCRSVESARLWKDSCTRARLADEFDLYAAGLHNVLAFHEIQITKGNMVFSPSSDEIEATHFPEEPSMFVKFLCARSERLESDPADLLQMAAELSFNGLNGPEVEIIDQDNNDIVGTLEKYISRTSRSFFENEPSSFMRPTLLLASSLVSSKLDPLLSRALSLWTATQILVDMGNNQWHISKAVSDLDSEGKTENRTPVQNTNPISHYLLTLQLRAFTERTAAQHAKTLMNDLERRLLQRQQASQQTFETFISAIILLNCVEKMCWLFSTWIDKPRLNSPSQSSHNLDINTLGGRPQHWPLERDAESFAQKGERIADIVSMILKVRGVPPAAAPGEDGILRPVVRVTNTGQPVTEEEPSGLKPDTQRSDEIQTASEKEDAVEEDDGPEIDADKRSYDLSTATETSAMKSGNDAKLIKQWFESVNVSVEQLEAAQDRPMEGWSPTDCRCWELRYIGKLLLPGRRGWMRESLS